ncbi:MAG: indole-3-glycerol phosphate synthase TrpC [Planctomycetota bacterium]
MVPVLADILTHKRDEIAAAKAARPLDQLKAAAAETPTPRNFFKAVTDPRRRLKVIAEIKRASPSAGLIRDDFDPVRLAQQYHASGAAAISCLTDEKFFQGDLAFIQQIKAVVPLPVLRKDFIVDAYQLYEARAAGADAVLLIAECLGEPQLIDLLILATELKLTVLLEVHDLESLIQIKSHLGFPHPGYQLLGINNRDLRTMTTDLQHTIDLLDEVPNKDILVSESGIKTHDDIATLLKHGVYRVLVGEHLMRQEDPGVALRELIHGEDGGESFRPQY